MKVFVWFVTILAHFSTIYACCNSCNTCHQQCATVVCVNQCQLTCCNTTTPCPSTTKAPTPTTTPTSVTTSRSTSTTKVTPRPERLETHESKMHMNVTSSNVINNMNTMNVNININKTIDNNIVSTKSRQQPTETRTIVVPKLVPVTILVPTNTTTPVTPTTTTTTTKPHPEKCCIVIIPCVSYGCNPYHYRCHGCHGSYGYVPLNPCSSGCHKKETWDREKCHLGQCVSHKVDCSYCGHDFYQTYGGYSRCHGCFQGYG